MIFNHTLINYRHNRQTKEFTNQYNELKVEKQKLEIKVDNLEIENQHLQNIPMEDGEKLGDNQAAHYHAMKKDMKKLIDFKYVSYL